MANGLKEEFGKKLHLGNITSIICVPKGEQVWLLGTKKLSPLKEKFYKPYK